MGKFTHYALLAVLFFWLMPALVSAQPVGVLGSVEFEGNTLLLVHAEDEQYAGDPYSLSTGGTISVVDVEPALLAGANPVFHLLVDRSFFCSDPSSCTADALEPLSVAIEQTFNPGETIVIASLADPTATASVIPDMDSIRPAVLSLWETLPESTPARSNLENYASTLSADQQHIVMLLVGGGESHLTALPAPAPILAVHVVFTGSLPSQCQQVVEQGGICIEANDPFEMTTMFAVDRLQNLYSVRLGCPEIVPGRNQQSVLVRGAGGQEIEVPLTSLVCTIEVGQSISPVLIYGGIAGACLAVLLLLIFIIRRPRQNDIPQIDLSAFGPNDSAHVRTSREVVAQRPEWLRRPELDDMRQALRQKPTTEADTTIMGIDRTDGFKTLALQSSSTITVGTSADATLRLTHGPAHALTIETDAFGKPRIVKFDEQADITLNGYPLMTGSALIVGDEVTIGHDVIFEIRSPAVGSRRLVAQDVAAFDPIDIHPAQSTVLGRNPLPYAGVLPIACKLAIPGLSADHIEIWQSGGRAFVRDLGSSNGTWVRDERIQPNRVTLVSPGDIVELASLVRFTVE